MEAFECRNKQQGYSMGSCRVEFNGKHAPACRVTLKQENGRTYRLITSIHLSRPENYLSMYQSGCNFSCRKCHSWYFSKIKNGKWYRPQDILKEAIAYDRSVTLVEPRAKATAWHAHDTCRCCGHCVVYGRRSSACPGILAPEAITLSPQGFGPVRNIAAFTGGDLVCCPEFYADCARLIHAHTNLWVLIETNGHGLTPQNLDYLQQSGVDAFWLDIKAFDKEKHKWLTGCSNKTILTLPEEILRRGFVLEVLSLYIPGLVEADELENIAGLLAAVDGAIPFTILAFFPEYRMKDFRSPDVREMVEAYERAKAAGLQHIRLGNLGVFARSQADQQYLAERVDQGAY
ncbi:MAG: radical SAM protein [Pseudomonadota bacterium]|uniref:Radical SAM protein n=1 Tax=Candidatus Desulfatibia profunda TaxID=2841695 RepID=A0A8J6NRX6_9BACT|nr:radical SAM protein [Candidatus Desulfatibia profunda]MBL7179946.1 radical SAM protein [Desulfobacterales bacterium]MBU0699285.1 radical SAM protein [Pseudomonadota bacterium]